MRSALPVVIVVSLFACTPDAPPRGGSPDASVILPTIAPAVDASVERRDASIPPAPRGTARLVIQHVEAQCMMGPGEKMQSFTVGYDVLLETDDGSDAGKPDRDHVFCSKQLPDGGVTKPRLGTWRNCREDKACAASTEGGVDHAEAQCGKDRVVLEVVEGKTVLRGPFGERVIVPYPMNIAPTKREKRIANVDC